MIQRVLSLSLLLFTLCIASAQEEIDPTLTEVWTPVPRVVQSGEQPKDAPSDAIVLFDGKNLDAWTYLKADSKGWELKDGVLTVQREAGDLMTKQSFGDVQLHLEFRTPAEVVSEGQGRGNSGIFLQDRYEIQILDNYQNKTYPNGQAGAVYKQHIPLVNACKGPGEWQMYDIIFNAPHFNKDGVLIRPAYVTVIHNGVLIQNHVEIKGPTVYRGLPKYETHDKAPIRLQDHGNPVSYRNIWLREL